VGRKWLSIAVVAAVLGVAVAVAAVSRGDKRPPPQRTRTAPVASQRFGDDADLMRRLERKKLVGQQR
jgi:hypothetical protein